MFIAKPFLSLILYEFTLWIILVLIFELHSFSIAAREQEQTFQGCHSCFSSLPVRPAPLAPVGVTKPIWSECGGVVNKDEVTCGSYRSIT